MNIQQRLQEEFHLRESQVENVLKLIDEGNTIPFIARYRKELTGSLDDQVLRELSDRLAYLRGLEKRAGEIRSSIDAQGKLTPELAAAVEKAATLAELEDLYRPYKQKRRTRASVAREKGLESLAAGAAPGISAPGGSRRLCDRAGHAPGAGGGNAGGCAPGGKGYHR